MKASTIVSGVLVAALGVGGVAWAAQSRPRALSYTTTVVTMGSITQTLNSTGVVRRPGQQSLTFDSPGLVTELSVKVGDQVRAGQRLAAVDTAPLQVSLLQAQAQLAQARAVLDADTAAQENGGSTAGAASGLVPGTTTTGSGAATGGAPITSAPSGTPTTPAYALALLQQAAQVGAAQIDAGQLELELHRALRGRGVERQLDAQAVVDKPSHLQQASRIASHDCCRFSLAGLA